MGRSSSFRPNPRAFREIHKKAQKQLDKQGPLKIPVQYETDSGEVSTGYTVNHNYGPTVHGDVTGSVLAWNNDSVDVTMHNTTEQIASGFEGIAEAVAGTLRQLPDIGLTDTDKREADEAAREVLAEVTKEAPDLSVIRKAATLLRGFLAPVVAGVQAGAAAEAQEQAQHAVQAISEAMTALS